MALLNLGKMSADLGLHDEALAANQGAAEIYQRLAAADPTAFQPDHARVRGNQSAWLMQLGRHREALAASEEAADIYRRLATANPAAFEPDLARVASNPRALAAESRPPRRRPLAVTQEAVDLHRRLATANPAAFEPDLANVSPTRGRCCGGWPGRRRLSRRSGKPWSYADGWRRPRRRRMIIGSAGSCRSSPAPCPRRAGTGRQ